MSEIDWEARKNMTPDQLLVEGLKDMVATYKAIADLREREAQFKIGIRFGDNDFHYTNLGVLASLEMAIVLTVNHSTETIIDFTKEQFAKVINEMYLAMYLLHQNRFSYNNIKVDGEEIERTRKYLTIDASRIYLNDEVDAYVEKLMSNDYANGEFHVLDMSKAPEDRKYTI